MVVVLTLVSWAAVSILTWYFISSNIPEACTNLQATLIKCMLFPWMLFWLWGIHNFWHQFLSMFPRGKKVQLEPVTDGPDVAIIYTTCDDFDSLACSSALNQTYRNTRLIICDDSKDPVSHALIDTWAWQHQGRVEVIRRKERKSFKAGNLNNAIGNLIMEDYILICDADEIIPPDFTGSLLPYLLNNEELGFVQAMHRARLDETQSRFACMLAPGIEMFYKHSLPLRNRFGFVCCFGHGILIRRSAWLKVGGFPEVVAEDLAFSSRLLEYGIRGMNAENVKAFEAYPPNYQALVRRYRKIVSGTVQYFQTGFWPLVKSKTATPTEKLDILLTFSFCFLGLVTLLNLFTGIYISYIYALNGYVTQSRWLLLLYLLGPLTPVAPLIRYLPMNPVHYARYFFSSAVAYTSLMPVFALKGVEQVFHLRKPIFEVTGNSVDVSSSLENHTFTLLCGVITLATALIFRSHVIAFAIGASIMFLTGPVLSYTESNGPLGALARNSGLLPYATISAVLMLTW